MTNPNHIYQAGNLVLDGEKQKACVGKKVIHLTGREYELLEYLMKHVNTIISRRKLLLDVWGGLDTFSNVIDVHIKNLRKKIEIKNSAIIETIRGEGYRLKVL